jgi:hypothetical protein
MKLIKNFTLTSATIKATILPINNINKLSFENTSGLSWYTSKVLLADAANMVGTAKKKENSAAAFLDNF